MSALSARLADEKKHHMQNTSLCCTLYITVLSRTFVRGEEEHHHPDDDPDDDPDDEETSSLNFLFLSFYKSCSFQCSLQS